MLLAEAGAVTLKEIVLDGTKIEANANRYTFVVGQSDTGQSRADRAAAERTLGICREGV